MCFSVLGMPGEKVMGFYAPQVPLQATSSISRETAYQGEGLRDIDWIRKLVEVVLWTAHSALLQMQGLR